MTPTHAALARNARLYPLFAAATSTLPWLPIFFLYFNERVGFDETLTLGAVYYIAVVVLEVPSGYLSDRVGRRPTLVLSCLFLLAAYAGFLVATSVAALVLCQTLLAGGIAFQSGSDSALLHDSLAALGRSEDYERAEARARVASMSALAVSCLVGGLLGSVALVWPYALAALAASVALGLALAFVEPPPDGGGADDAASVATAVSRDEPGGGLEAATPPARGAETLARCLADPLLRWLLAWHVLAFALAHLPYEFQQPWIRLLGESGSELGRWLAGDERAPVVSGAVAALSMTGGVLGALLSVRLSTRLGLARLLALANAVQLLIVVALAAALHPLVLVPLFTRGLAMAMTHAPVMAAIAPRVASARRATWLSVQSLAGRLGFSLVLFALAGAVGAALDWATLSRVLTVCTVLGAALAVTLWWLGPRSGSASRRALQ